MPLDDGFRFARVTSRFGLAFLEVRNRIIGCSRRLNWSGSDTLHSSRAKLHVGVRDLIVHRGHQVNACNVTDGLQHLGGVPESMDEGRIAGSHSANLDGAWPNIVQAVVEHLGAEDLAPVLEDGVV